MAVRIKARYDTIQNWQAAGNTAKLLPGELAIIKLAGNAGIEVRVGDGTGEQEKVWDSCPLITSGSGNAQYLDDLLDVVINDTQLEAGSILYYDGQEWTNASLASRIMGGNNIQVVEEEDGKLTINYFTATYSPTVTFNSENNQVTTGNIIIEVRNKYNNNSYNATTNKGGLGPNVDFTVTNGGNVNVANGVVLGVVGENYNQNAAGSLFSFTSHGNKFFPVIDMDTNGSFGANISAYKINSESGTRSDTLNVSLTSTNQTTGGAPYTSSTVVRTLNFSYGIRYFFVWSQTSFDAASNLQASYNSTPGNFDKVIDAITTSVPLSDQTITSPLTAGNWYLYFFHSSNGTGSNDTFGWTPVFRAANNDLESFTEISSGPAGIIYDTSDLDINNPAKQYRVWKFSNPVSPNTQLVFKVQ